MTDVPVLPPDNAGVKAAIVTLLAGGVVAVPTDTVYGVAVALDVPGATDKLFAVKRRPHDVDLPVLVGDPSDVAGLAADVPATALRLIERFWPGPLTLVLPRSPAVSADLGTSSATIGIRCPDHPLVRRLAAAVGPLATTSANLHGNPTPADAPGVAAELADGVVLVLDGGRCEGAPSTVVDCTTAEPRLLRAGRLSWDELRAAVG